MPHLKLQGKDLKLVADRRRYIKDRVYTENPIRCVVCRYYKSSLTCQRNLIFDTKECRMVRSRTNSEQRRLDDLVRSILMEHSLPRKIAKIDKFLNE